MIISAVVLLVIGGWIIVAALWAAGPYIDVGNDRFSRSDDDHVGDVCDDDSEGRP